MKTEQLLSIALEFREGSSDKVYRAEVKDVQGGYVVNFAYGRRGTTLTTGTKTSQPVAYDEAVVIYEKLVKSKTSKGYKPAGGVCTGAGIGSSVTDREQRDTGLRAQLLNPINEDEAERYLADNNWCAQEKFDGRRMMVRKAGTEITAANKNGLSIGLPDELANLANQADDFVIDGESVGPVFYAFDLLESDSTDMRPAPYQTRLSALHTLFSDCTHIVVAGTAVGSDKRKFMADLKAAGKEGTVFKDLRAQWSAGLANSDGTALKCKFWASCSCTVLKVNARRSIEVALGGQSVGNVTIPANHEIPVPGQVVEVRYLYVTGLGGSLYQPIYLGVRDDVAAAECTVDRQRLKYKAQVEAAA